MSIKRLLTQPLALQKMGTTTDEYNDEVYGPVGEPVPFLGYLEQTSAAEYLDGRVATVTKWRGWAGTEVPVQASDQIIYGETTFEVDGEVERVWNPRTRTVSHLRFNLNSSKGG